MFGSARSVVQGGAREGREVVQLSQSPRADQMGDRSNVPTLARFSAGEPSWKPLTTTLPRRASSSTITPIGRGRLTASTWLGWGSTLRQQRHGSAAHAAMPGEPRPGEDQRAGRSAVHHQPRQPVLAGCSSCMAEGVTHCESASGCPLP